MDPDYIEARRDAIGAVVTAVVLTAIGLGLLNYRMHLVSDLGARGRHATAIVTDVVEHRRRRSTSYHLEYQYFVDNVAYPGRKLVSREEARAARPGEYVDVYFDTADPGRHVPRSVAEARADFRIERYVVYPLVVLAWGWAYWKVAWLGRQRGPRAGRV
jgi:hypothetical protein